MTARAKVVLKKCKTYILPGDIDSRRWIKDVPIVITGNEKVDAYTANAFFSVTRLKDLEDKKKKKKNRDKDGKKKNKGKGKLKK